MRSGIEEVLGSQVLESGRRVPRAGGWETRRSWVRKSEAVERGKLRTSRPLGVRGGGGLGSSGVEEKSGSTSGREVPNSPALVDQRYHGLTNPDERLGTPEGSQASLPLPLDPDPLQVSDGEGVSPRYPGPSSAKVVAEQVTGTCSGLGRERRSQRGSSVTNRPPPLRIQAP